MSNTFHDLYVGHNNHALTANTDDSATGYATTTERDADTDWHGDSDNINKLVRIASPVSFYILVSNVGPVWHQFGNTTIITENSFIVNSQFSPEVDLVFYDGLVAQEDITITKGSLFAVAAPTGADLIIDLLIDGVAQTTLLNLTAASMHEITDFTNLAITTGQRVGLKYTQIGSLNPGNGIIATVYYHLT